MWELSVSACALCERQKNVHLRNLYASKAAAVSSCKLCPVLTGNSTQSLRSTPSWLFYLKTRETLCTHILIQCIVQNVCEANYQNKVAIRWTTGSFRGGIPQVRDTMHCNGLHYLVDFCISTKSLSLIMPQCGECHFTKWKPIFLMFQTFRPFSRLRVRCYFGSWQNMIHGIVLQMLQYLLWPWSGWLSFLILQHVHNIKESRQVCFSTPVEHLKCLQCCTSDPCRDYHGKVKASLYR